MKIWIMIWLLILMKKKKKGIIVDIISDAKFRIEQENKAV